MKVALINNIYPPYDRGGAEQVVVKIVEGLLSAGHTVVMVTSTPRNEEVDHHNNLTVYRIRPGNIFFYTTASQHGIMSRFLWHLFDIGNIYAAYKIKKILEREKPDVVHTHNLMGLSFLVPWVIRQLSIRHVHTVHDVQLVEPSAMILKSQELSWRYNGFLTKVYVWIMKQLIGSPDVVLSASQFLRDFYAVRGFFPHSRIEVVRNPVTFTIGSVHLNAMSDNNIFRFIYVGQVEAHKGVANLVRAFCSLVENNVQLHIVGGGTQLDVIKTLAGNDKRITVYDRVDRKELPVLFSTMNMTVVPSLCYENSPSVIFESFACGVPVLASNIEGIAELIHEGENGLTFEAGNEKVLQERLMWCMDHPKEISMMGIKTTQSLIGLSLSEYIVRLKNLYQANSF